MKGIDNDPSVVQSCDQLLNQINCDFVGLAIQNNRGPDIRWHYAVGNRNEKYKKITVRYGKGIAGKVISTGSPMMIDHFPNHILGKAIEYPIMLAEKLISTYAVPIFLNSSPKGALLVGRRSSYTFLENERLIVQDFAKNMEEMLANLELKEELKRSMLELVDLKLSLDYEITQRKTFEDELQKMATKIIDVQEEERKSISRNLHDGLGQNLYSHLITINLLQAQINHPLIEQMQKEAMQLIEEVREISWELRPSVLDDLGLVPAIRSFLARYSNFYHIEVHFNCFLHRRLDINKELTIYRIIQEALTNIRKYADVKEAWITLKELGNTVIVSVEDCGKGFEPSQVSRGVGIFSMEERARAVGGVFHLQSIPGKGTILSLKVPFSRQASI
jgi:signal transduction histidine kinase